MFLTKEVGFLTGRLSDIGFDIRLKVMRDVVTDDVVDSYAIEGINLNKEEVRSSVAKKLGVEVDIEKDSSHYIDGIVEVMLDAINNYDAPLTEKRLFNWHTMLFPNNARDIIIGAYRQTGMKVISGMMGREKIHYIAPQPTDIAPMMKDFLTFFNQKQEVTTYLKSAIAHLWFVSIHPFDDGNGRMARAISDMALSQADNSKMRFFSVSKQINIEKKYYYRILEQTQKSNGDITEWID